VKAADQLPRAARGPGLGVAEGVLELVAVAPRLLRRDDLGEREAAQSADPLERLLHLFALDLQLALVPEHLPGDARVRGERGDPLGPRLEHLERARVRVAALALVHHRAHPIARDRAGDEHHVAALAQARDPLAAVGERVDPQLEHVAALRARWRLPAADSRVSAHGLATSSSSSAFCAWRRFSAWSQMRWRCP